MSKEYNLIKELLSDDKAQSWNFLNERDRPAIMDRKYPTLPDEYSSFDEEFEGVPTFQIPIILSAIRHNPEPSIISAMIDALVLAKMTYSDGELDEIECTQNYHDRHKAIAKSEYDKYCSLHEKHTREKESGDTHIKRTFKELLDMVMSYEDSDYTKQRLALVHELLKYLDVMHRLVFTEENFATKLNLLKTLNPYSLLDRDDQELWDYMNTCQNTMSAHIFGYPSDELSIPELKGIIGRFYQDNGSK